MTLPDWGPRAIRAAGRLAPEQITSHQRTAPAAPPGNVNREDLVRGVGSIVLVADGGGPAHAFVDELRLRRSVRAALDARLWPVVVVVSDPADEFRASLAGLPVATVANANVAAGQAAALRLGLKRVSECAPDAVGVVVVACDPPVEADHLRALAAAARPRRGALAASSHDGQLGLPVFFPAAVFPELRALAAGELCTDVLARHASEVEAVVRR